MKSKVALSVLLLTIAIIAGCRARPEKVKRYDQPLGLGQNALRKVTDPLEIPDFTMASLELTGLREATAKSLNYLSKPSSKQFFPINDITHEQAVASLKRFMEMLDSGLRGRQLNDSIREEFDVYMSVGCDNEGTVLFTGYYTPIFDGSKVRSGRFRYPLYRQPEDLVKDSNGEIIGRRGPDGQIGQYPVRAVIENSGMLRGKELFWLEDAFEAYIASVQGSAKIRLPDDSLVTAGYAANNGHEYRSISQEMVREGKISRDQLSLSAMIAYFKANPGDVARYVNRNPRYVFFREQAGEPRGSLNELVTTMRTIATDKSIFPRGCLTFLSTKLPAVTGSTVSSRYYSGFALDQDTGGAIRAPGRCDVYMGQGEIAGKLAGHIYQEGRLYYLFLKQGS